MIRYLLNRPTTDGKFYAVIAGLSTDAKPTADLITGSRFVEADTGKAYLFNETGSSWAESQQFTEAVAAYLDDHPEALDQAAIEAIFDERLDGIEDDLSGLKSAIDSFTFESPNLFDKTMVVPGKACTTTNSETLVDSTSYDASPIIPAKVNTKYTFSSKLQGNGAKIYVYTSSGAYAGQINCNANDDGTYTFAGGANVEQIRFNITPSECDINSLIVVEGETIPDEYWGYKQRKVTKDAVEYVIDEKIDPLFEESKNLFNSAEVLPNTTLAAGSGQTINSTSVSNDYDVSNIIPVSAGSYVSNHMLTGSGTRIFAYDASGNYLGGIDATQQSDGSYLYTLAANVKQVRFRFTHGFLPSNYMFCSGTALPSVYWGYKQERLVQNAAPVEDYTKYEGKEITVFKKIICIGDSITAGTFNYNHPSSGYLSDTDYSYPEYLGKLTGLDVTNFGRGGYSATQFWTAYQNHDWSGFDAAIIMFGINDALQGDTTATYKSSLTSLINSLKSYNSGIKIFLATLTPAYSDGVTTFNGMITATRELAESLTDVYLIDINRYSECHKGTPYEQGHLTAIGYYQMAHEFMALISFEIQAHLSDFANVQFINTEYSY